MLNVRCPHQHTTSCKGQDVVRSCAEGDSPFCNALAGLAWSMLWPMFPSRQFSRLLQQHSARRCKPYLGKTFRDGPRPNRGTCSSAMRLDGQLEILVGKRNAYTRDAKCCAWLVLGWAHVSLPLIDAAPSLLPRALLQPVCAACAQCFPTCFCVAALMRRIRQS